MSDVKLRSWTVPNGSKFVCVPQDGSGPFIAEAGEQVVIVSREKWDEAIRDAMAEMVRSRDPR